MTTLALTKAHKKEAGSAKIDFVAKNCFTTILLSVSAHYFEYVHFINILFCFAARSKPFQLKIRSNSDQTENARISQNG